MSKPNGLRAALRGKRIALAVTAAFLPWDGAQAQTPPAANTLPTNGAFAPGSTGTIHAPTADNYLRVDQSSTKGIINWGTFSIGSAAHVHFNHDAGRAGMTLNRVVGNEASQIFGRLSSTGQIFLVNNAGVLFAPGAAVDVGALLASTLSISDQNFLNGNYQFYNPGNAGSVTNAGSIITSGGYTALVGPQVRNDGVILANAGKVALAAGNAVSLAIGDNLISVVVDEAAYNASVINTGTLQADGGTVLLKAKSMNALLDTVINTSGVVRATSLFERNGEIVLDGGGPNGGIIASGETRAGHVTVAGGSLHVHRHSPDPMLPNGLLTGDTIDVNVAGGVLVDGGGQISSRNGQSITAHSLVVKAQAGETASISNENGEQLVTVGSGGVLVEANGGNAILVQSALIGAPTDSQTLEVSGGSIDVRSTAPGGGAAISAVGAQSLTVTNGDHIAIDGQAGVANIQGNAGAQTISITGSGANAIRIGAETAAGWSIVNGPGQTITAGDTGEAGSITITGSAATGGFTHIANIGTGGTTPQTIRTSGTLSVSGGTAAAAGIFQNTAAEQRISAASVTVQGGSSGAGNGAFINSTFGGGQLFNVAGELKVAASTGGAAGIFNGTNTPLPGTTTPNTNSAAQTINAGSVVLEGGAAGTNHSAFINSTFGGNQTLNVPGEIRVVGGSGGTNNRAGIQTNASQTITGNPELVLKGGDGGSGNNVFIQATSGDVAKPQTINARRIELRSGAGIDASATLNAARNVITTTGDVSVYGGAGLGGSNGARIGGIGGTTLGPTNLTLTVGGDLLLHGGTVNGASLGSSGPSTQTNTITVSAANVKLESDGAGARIGASNQTPVPGGTIAVTAAGELDVGAGTAIRASGPVTPPVGTPPTAITLTANSLTNDGTITNGGASAANIALIANAFDLNGGNIQGGNAAVILRPRDGTRSFGIESGIQSATNTTLTNADLASINTTNFVVLGSGTGTNFTGDMTIGQNARVDGGTKGLAFFRTSDPLARSGSITIGAQGVATGAGADVIVGAGNGNIVSAGGTITGDEVQLRARTGIGADGARVNTSANALAINNSTGAVFVSEADGVDLRTVTLNVGGMSNLTSNFTGGSLELAAGGVVNVIDSVTSNGGQTISAQSLNVTAQGGRLVQLLNNGGTQTITAGSIDVQTGAGGGTAEIRNNSLGQQEITVTGDHLNVHGLGGGLATVFAGGNQLIQTTGLGPRHITLGSEAALGASTINAGGDQTITGRADIVMTGGAGPVQDGHNAIISAFNPTRTQRIEAGNLTLANSTLGGLNSVAAILGATQLIDATGDVMLTANASGGPLPGVRIGGLGGGGSAATGTNLTLTLDGNLILTGGTLAGNGVGIGSTASPSAPPLANFITIDAGGSVILNTRAAGAGARIGSPQTVTGPGDIRITAGGDIRLDGVAESTVIRNAGSVELHAASISEAAKGAILTTNLATVSTGDTTLTGPNQVAAFNATSTAGSVVLNNTGVLDVTGMNAALDATIDNAGNVTVSGPWSAGGTSTISVGSDIVLSSLLRSNDVVLEADGGSIIEAGGFIEADTLSTASSLATSLGGENRVGSYSGTAGADLFFFNRGDLEVTSLSAASASLSNNGAVTISGPWVTSGQTNVTAFGFGASLSESAGGFIQASGFNGLSAEGSVNLDGANRISGALNGSSMQGDFRLTNTGDLNFGVFSFFGDVNLTNAGALNVTNLSGRNVAVTNNGPMTVTGFWNSQAATSITTSGAGSDLSVTSSVFSNGPMTVNVDGALTVTAGTAALPPLQQFVSLTSNAGQDLTAKSMRVAAENGGVVLINNQGTGNQNITVTEGDLSILASGDGVSPVPASTVQIFNFGSGPQTVDVAGAIVVAAKGMQPPPPPPPGIPPVPPPPGVPATSPVPQFAILGSAAGQHITAHSIAVTAEDGAAASINNQSNQVPFGTGTPGGNQSVVVSGGGITIRSSGGPGSSSAQIVNSSFGDQAVTGDQLITVSGGGSIDLLSTGGFASISNSAFDSAGFAKAGGSQTITVVGGNVDIRSAAPMAGAFISQSAAGAAQSVSVIDGQRLKIEGAIGNASISANGGTQTVSVTGGGANAIELGSAGALGFSQIAQGSRQEVTAGTGTQQGSITIVGPAANSTTASIVSRAGPEGTQTIATTGLLSITGGTAPNQTFASGLFHNGSGVQSIRAGAIALSGGPSGNGNRALIASTGGGIPANAGNQVVYVAGGQISVRGSEGGSANVASITSSADQTIDGNPDIVLVGGASTLAGVTNANTATIQTALGRSQTVRAGTITMTNSPTANPDSFAGITASHQAITTTGDVRLTANGGSARIGGVSGAATDLHLTVGGNLVLDGGSLPTNGAGIGSPGIGAAFANDITIVASGDVILNSGSSGARIGSGAATGIAGGDISISGRSIQLNGTSASAAIRTLGNVVLDAGQPAGTISETGNAFVIANTLHTSSHGQTNLEGANQVATFSATSAASDVSLNNSGALNVTGMSAFGDATITNLGDVTVSGPWTAGGTSSITVGSSIFLKSHMESHDVQLVSTTGDIVQDAAASIEAVNLSTISLGDTHLAGTNTVENIDVSSTEGDVSLRTVSALLRLNDIDLPGALVVDNTGAIAVTGSVSALAHDLRATGDVTVGGAGEKGATLLYAPGSISISTPGAIRVRGSDTSAGAGSAIFAGEALNLSAGNVSLTGGAALATPAAMRGQSVSMTLDGNLAVTGGSGHFSAAVLSSGSNIDLTVGGQVRIDAGSGYLSLARIQTEIRDGVIHITFPNLTTGGYFVNGLEGDNHHGQTGFFTLNKPAKLGSTLLVDYGT